MTNSPYTILAECRTYESWTVSEHGTPESFHCDHEGVDPEAWYVNDSEGDYQPEFFDTFEEAQKELDRLNKLYYQSNPQNI